MRVETRVVYVAEDGTEFYEEGQALLHERRTKILKVIDSMCINSETMTAGEIADEFLAYKTAIIEALQ